MDKMKKNILALILILMSAGIISAVIFLLTDIKDKSMPSYKKDYKTDHGSELIKLPEPAYDSGASVEKALLERRSVRNYKDKPLELSEVSQLLWAAQGITDFEKGFKTAPSAGALYPLEVYMTGDIQGAAKGLYKYNPESHSIIRISDKDLREELSEAAYDQKCVSQAPAVLIFTGVYEKIAVKYGEEKAPRYTHLEAGHAAQNVYLQAESLNLGTVAVGGFDIEKVKEVLNLPDSEEPLYLMPVGKKY